MNFNKKNKKTMQEIIISKIIEKIFWRFYDVLRTNLFWAQKFKNIDINNKILFIKRYELNKKI